MQQSGETIRTHNWLYSYQVEEMGQVKQCCALKSFAVRILINAANPATDCVVRSHGRLSFYWSVQAWRARPVAVGKAVATREEAARPHSLRLCRPPVR